MSTDEALTAVLTQPTCQTLCALQAELLQAGYDADDPLLRRLEGFFIFLNHLSAGMSARQFSHLATLFDIGAVGGVAAQNLLEAKGDPKALWKRLLAGALSESLMVIASRQYVKAAEAEMTGAYREAGWFLYRELWRISSRLQPQQTREARRQALDQLLAPVHDTAVPGSAKAVLLARLFQLLLLLTYHQQRT
jgi:O-methyltransferase involved in polyketide biosynthesis